MTVLEAKKVLGIRRITPQVRRWAECRAHDPFDDPCSGAMTVREAFWVIAEAACD